jgi:hypothetical protein
MAFSGHAGRFWSLTRWRSLARIGDMVFKPTLDHDAPFA